MDAYQLRLIYSQHDYSRLCRSLALLDRLGTEVDSRCDTLAVQYRRDSFRWLQYVSASDDATTRERVERSSDRLALAVHVYIGGGNRWLHHAYRLQDLECASQNR